MYNTENGTWKKGRDRSLSSKVKITVLVGHSEDTTFMMLTNPRNPPKGRRENRGKIRGK